MSDIPAIATSAIAMGQANSQQQMEMSILKQNAQADREVADMIIKLGGMPVISFGDIEKNANAPYPMPPKKTDDYAKIIEFILDAEAGAIDAYRKIAKKTFGKEDVVYQLVTHILGEEVNHEEIFENLK